MFIELNFSATNGVNCILQALNFVMFYFECDHSDTIFTSIIVLLDVLNFKMLQLLENMQFKEIVRAFLGPDT